MAGEVGGPKRFYTATTAAIALRVHELNADLIAVNFVSQCIEDLTSRVDIKTIV